MYIVIMAWWLQILTYTKPAITDSGQYCRQCQRFVIPVLRVEGARYCVTSRKAAGSIPDEVIKLFFNCRKPYSRTMALGSTQPPIEMNTRNLPRGKERPARKADNLTAICEPICLENVGSSTSHNRMGLHCVTGMVLVLYL
jgi:hypothetical protein